MNNYTFQVFLSVLTRSLSVMLVYVMLQRSMIILDDLEQAAILTTIRTGFICLLCVPVLLVTSFRVLIIILGLVGVAYSADQSFWPGYLFASIAISTVGLSVKEFANQSHIQASWGRIGQVVGYLCAGTIAYWVQDRFSLSAVLILYLCFCLFMIPYFPIRKPTIKSVDGKIMVGAILLGTVTGIRVLGVYVILANYLNTTLGSIPWWYGLELIFYATVVGIVQIPIIFFKWRPSFHLSLLFLGLSCAVLFNPSFFSASTPIGCALWLLILALEEGVATGVDVVIGRKGATFWREVGFGFGGVLLAFSVFHLENYLITMSLLFLTIYFGGYVLSKHENFEKNQTM